MSQWIKCSDRMPDIGVPVLIRIPVCGNYNVENGKYQGGGEWHGAWCSSRGEGHYYKVTQWAEMPGEPK